MYNEIT